MALTNDGMLDMVKQVIIDDCDACLGSPVMRDAIQRSLFRLPRKPQMMPSNR